MRMEAMTNTPVAGALAMGLFVCDYADIGITIVILAMLGKLPVRRVVEWARAHRWI